MEPNENMIRNSDLIVPPQISLCDAMRIIDRSEVKILFVAEGGKLLGALTDGDIRRFLFRGGKIEEPVGNACNRSPRVAENVWQAAEVYDRLNCIAVPVVNDSWEILDIYIGEENRDIQKEQLGIPVVINAGGKGTRLDPFTRVLPKPLIPVGEKPIIEHIMQQYEGFGCSEFHVIVNYKKQLLKAYFNENEEHYDIRWYDEARPLGTGGGLSLLRGKLDGTFFFSNCDILLLSNYASMLKFHRENGNAVTMVCAWKNHTIPYGVVEIGKNGVIEAMREKPELSFLTNTGMYIVEPEVLEDIAPDTSISFPEIIQAEIRKGRKAAAYPVSESEWLDMGQMSELEKMRIRLYGK